MHGYDPMREGMRTFALARIQRLEVTQGKFQRDLNFSAHEWLRESFGVYEGAGTKLKTVKLRFDAFGAQHVRERKWHHSQEISNDDADGLVLTLRLSALEEVERWVMSWGGHVEVLAPVVLKRKMASYGLWLAGKYEGA